MTQKQIFNYDALHRVWPSTDIEVVFKLQPEDFVVEETLPFELEGEGEHAWLYVEKRGSNTDWVAGKLSEYAGIKSWQVGYAGLKDRHALCRQWFSVHLPGIADPDWSQLDNTEFKILQQVRHRKKLSRGALKKNQFTIRLRDIQGDISVLIERCAVIKQYGTPNYFGIQRFGHQMENIPRAIKMFASRQKKLARHKRSLYLSAARSWIFNEILSQRIQKNCWDSRIEGDVFMLDGKSACFTDDASTELDIRLSSGEIHPTAALWGDGDSLADAKCAQMESAIAADNEAIASGLEDARLEPKRRATRLIPADFRWQQQDSDLILEFSLSAGGYATSVLRELAALKQPSRGDS